MKSIKDIQNCKLERNILHSINGGDNFNPTGKNADGKYTDVWSPNAEGNFGEGSSICGVAPYIYER